MRNPPSAVSSTLLSGSREMSISSEGRSTSSFIRSIRLVPPAMNFAVGSATIWRTASATSLARAYWKLIMAAHRLLNRCYDVGIRSATADIATHKFANLVSALCVALGDQAGGGTDLSRSAVSALECIVINESLLQRMQGAIRRQPSTVVTLAPSFMTASVRQELIRR